MHSALCDKLKWSYMYVTDRQKMDISAMAVDCLTPYCVPTYTFSSTQVNQWKKQK